MKKVLALVLVLGMASISSAALNLSLNGQVAPAEVTLFPSDTLILGIDTDTAYAADTGASFYIVVDAMTASFDESKFVGTHAANTSMAYTVASLSDAGVVLPLPAPEVQDGMFGNLTGFGVSIPVGKFIDNLIFHCEGEGDSIIQLWLADDGYAPVEVVGSILVHQVPEPMTMSLLALGGLSLLRRRR